MTRKKTDTTSSSSSTTESGGSAISDIARRLLLTGVGAIFMTEESIRNAISDLKLPKEAVGYVFEQAKKQKDDLVTIVAAEVSKFLSKINVHEEITKVLTSLQIHIDATLSFTPKGKESGDRLKIEVKRVGEDEE